MSDRSAPESPPIAPTAVTWLAHPPSVHWDPHRYRDGVMPRGVVRPRTRYTPGDPHVEFVAHLPLRCHAAAHSAARAERSPRVGPIASMLWAAPQCAAETGRLVVWACRLASYQSRACAKKWAESDASSNSDYGVLAHRYLQMDASVLPP